MEQKRLVTVQDISCFGKCSLTAAIPIISAFGIETVALPTALLSTHTGGFEGYSFKDLSDEMPKIIHHWEKLNINFDAMYSGYFGSVLQLEIVKKFFEKFKTDKNLVFVDPVMADDGRLYTGFDLEFADKMRSLCSIADIITPNVTEASYLVKTPYRDEYDENYIHFLAHEMAKTNARLIIITGVSIGEKFGAVCYNAKTDEFYSYYKKKIPGKYYGTGDIFASTLCGALTIGLPFEKAVNTAIDFVYQSIVNTLDEPQKYKYGVKFEQSLKMLTDLA